MTAWPIRFYNITTIENRRVTVSGTVTDISHRNEKLQIYINKIILSDDDNSISQLNNDETMNLRGAVVYPSDTCDEPFIGSRITVTGTAHGFEEKSNPGQFDMRMYYRIRGTDLSIANAEIARRSSSYSRIRQAVYEFRRTAEKAVDIGARPEDSAILKAMILGDKDYLDSNDKDLFAKAGIAHLLVVSGTHIGILGVAVFEMLRRISGSFRLSCAAAGIFIFLYAMITGFGPATMRAAIMFGLCMVARSLGRAYDIMTALAIACVVSLVLSPLLIYDSGFLLSFCAVMGIGLLLPIFDDIKGKIVIFRIPGLMISISVSLFTLPITLYNYSYISTYSLIVNLLLVPLSGLLICSGILGMMLFFLPFSGVVSHLIIYIYKTVCAYTVMLPGSIRVVKAPSLARIAIYYVIIFTVIICRDRFRRSYMACLILALNIFVLTFSYQSGLDITMIDVGQGLCVLLRSPEGCVLYDAGSSDVDRADKYRIIPALRSLGVSDIDMLIVSHTDDDHINAVTPLLNAAGEGIEVRALGMSSISAGSDAGRRLISAAGAAGVKCIKIDEGTKIGMGRLSLKCIYPKAEFAGDTNEGSLCITLRYGEFGGILTGDVEGRGEEYLIRECTEDIDIDFYQAAHHGSNNSGSDELMARLSPIVTFISCGRNNSYGHPGKQATERIAKTGSRIYVTKDDGALFLWTDGRKIKVRTQL